MRSADYKNKFQRTLASAWTVQERVGPNGKNLCHWCSKELDPPMKTFCGDPICMHEYKIRSNSSYAREQVFKRDKGVCASCGLDTEKLREVLTAVRLESEEIYLDLVRQYRRKYKFGFHLDKHWYEMDHILPVAEGGGSCGLNNLQTLCLVCHRSKTREQRRRKRCRRKGIVDQWKKL
jgi:5-methylcytosine-specific restriction endonuclease McrA